MSKPNYLDFVTCTHKQSGKKYLFCAPRWSYLKPGDEVVVDTNDGKQFATVVSTMTVKNDPDDEDVKFILDISGATWPLKRVLGKCTVYDLNYEEYDEVEDDEQTEQTEK